MLHSWYKHLNICFSCRRRNLICRMLGEKCCLVYILCKNINSGRLFFKCCCTALRWKWLKNYRKQAQSFQQYQKLQFCELKYFSSFSHTNMVDIINYMCTFLVWVALTGNAQNYNYILESSVVQILKEL